MSKLGGLRFDISICETDWGKGISDGYVKDNFINIFS